jgi:hypothetical protein
MSLSEFSLHPQLPPPRQLQRLLNRTTERLCAECAQAMPDAPQWDEAHWRVAQAVSAMHGISAWLQPRLSWEGPPQWQAFLAQQARHTLARHQGFVTLRNRIDAGARHRGLAVVALKGIALHDLGLYRPGDRPMADIDLLVRDRDLAAADELLGSLGYREHDRNRRERVYVPVDSQSATGFGEHMRNIVKIELHTRIAERLPVRTIDITRLLLPRAATVGLQGYDTAATLMTHLLLHGAGNMRSRSLRCMQLNDIAVVAGGLERTDWDQVLYYERQFGSGWVYPLLALTSRYYTHVVPAEVLHQAAAQCHHGLRRASARQQLSDVSLSRSWIDFAPGMEWCGSLAEKLHFARSRVFPDPAMRAETAACESIQGWAQQSPWFRLSRPRRVLRWLLSRPQRVATIASVRQAWHADSMPERAA